jgi:protein arginine kinase activator
MKCDNCNKPATVHLTEITQGKKIEKHLCEQCAAQNDILPVGKTSTPINELLSNFVMAHSGVQKEQAAACENCGMTWSDFRQNGLFGCEHDYDQFAADLSALLKSAHDGATKHEGKVPVRAGGASPRPKKKAVDMSRLKKELARAVEQENYELAAKLRDQIRQAEEGLGQ